jgi:hypothetical protein
MIDILVESLLIGVETEASSEKVPIGVVIESPAVIDI